MWDKSQIRQAADLLDRFRQRRLKLAVAESCTGGLVAALLTEIAGSSDVFDRGFVTYSNEAKQQLLGVPQPTLQTHGAVSEQTAIAMAEGVIAHSQGNIAVSITGIAGPGGGSADKPVGLVYIGMAARDGQGTAERFLFTGTRHIIRMAAVHAALEVFDSGLKRIA
jgi:nicotinamide-nucleotide amidase